MEKENRTDKHLSQENTPTANDSQDLIRQNLEIVENFCRNQNFIGAVTLLTQLLEQHPDSDELHRKRASVFLAMSLPFEAAKDLDALHDMTLEDLVARVNIYIQNQETSKAFEVLKQRNEQHPDSKAEYLLISQLHASAHDYNAALEILQKGMDRIAVFPEAYKERGRIRMLLHDSQGAMDDLRKALEQDPTLLDGLNGTLSNQ